MQRISCICQLGSLCMGNFKFTFNSAHPVDKFTTQVKNRMGNLYCASIYWLCPDVTAHMWRTILLARNKMTQTKKLLSYTEQNECQEKDMIGRLLPLHRTRPLPFASMFVSNSKVLICLVQTTF